MFIFARIQIGLFVASYRGESEGRSLHIERTPFYDWITSEITKP